MQSHSVVNIKTGTAAIGQLRKSHSKGALLTSRQTLTRIQPLTLYKDEFEGTQAKALEFKAPPTLIQKIQKLNDLPKLKGQEPPNEFKSKYVQKIKTQIGGQPKTIEQLQAVTDALVQNKEVQPLNSDYLRVFLKNSVTLEESKVKTELKIQALQEPQQKSEFYKVPETEMNSRNSRRTTSKSTSVEEDLKARMDMLNNRDFNKINPKRVQGKLINEWFLHHMQSFQDNLKANPSETLKICENINHLCETTLQQVIDEYSLAQCTQWAAILQKIVVYNNFSYQTACKKFQSEAIQLRKAHEAEKEMMDAQKVEELRAKDKIICDLKQQIDYLKTDMGFIDQRVDLQVNKASEQQKRIQALLDDIQKLNETVEQRDRKIEGLELKVVKHKSKKRFIRQQIQKQLNLNNQLEEQLASLKQQGVTGAFNASLEAASVSASSANITFDEDSAEDPALKENRLQSAKALKNLEVQGQLHQLFKQGDKEYTRQNLEKASILAQQQPPSPYGKISNQKGERNALSASPGRRTLGRDLEELQILDSESDSLAHSVGNDFPEAIFDHDELRQELEHKRNYQRKERRFIKQGKFINKFLQELRINDKFDSLQKFIQNRIINDEFILRILLENKHNQKRQPKKLDDKKVSIGGAQPTPTLIQKDLKASQTERKGFQAYIRPLLSLKLMQQTVEKKPFKMKAENLYEVVYAIVGQMFLTQIDTIDQLMKDLKSKFPSQSHIMDENYIKPVAQKPEQKEEKKDASTLKLKAPKSSTGKRNTSVNQLHSNTDILNINVEGKGFQEQRQFQNQFTQTGEEYDEFILLSSIQGLDTKVLFVPGEASSKHHVELHKIDLKNNKLIKLQLLNVKTNDRKPYLNIKAQEYLPQDVVEKFLPFNCVIKLDQAMQDHQANIYGYENSRAQFNPQIQKIVTELQLNEKLVDPENAPLMMLPGYGKQPVQVKKGQQQHLSFNIADAAESLNEYYKLLHEVIARYKLPSSKVKYLQKLCLNKDDTFTKLPPSYQLTISQLIDASIAHQLQTANMLQHEKHLKIQALKKYELSLDRLNLKVKFLLNSIQELEVRKTYLENKGIMVAFQQHLKNKANIEMWRQAHKILTRAHTDGFNLGVTHGKMLGAALEKTLMINQGQINGVKHGWINGFEAGQINGIKKVFIEAYMNNINLYEKLAARLDECSVLENINMPELRKEAMNEFNKAFREVPVQSNQTNRYKMIIDKYIGMSPAQKLKYKKIPKRVLLKYIFQIYQEKQNQLQRQGKEVSIMEAMNKYIALNYGNNNVTDSRIFRVFSSALFNCANGGDLRKELDYQLQRIEKMNEGGMDFNPFQKRMTIKEQKIQVEKEVKIHYRIIHFTKFCQISDALSNLSSEVLSFYIDVITSLRENTLNVGKVGGFGDEHNNNDIMQINTADEDDVDVVSLQRAYEVIQSHFTKILPTSTLTAFRKHIDVNLKIKDANSVVQWVDLDKFMDQSLILFLRFNKIVNDNLNRIYYAWTLFAVDYIDFDQIYITLKLLCPISKKIKFRYQSGPETVSIQKNLKDVMRSVHDKFGITQTKKIAVNTVQDNDKQANFHKQLFDPFEAEIENNKQDLAGALAAKMKLEVTQKVRKQQASNFQMACLNKIKDSQEWFPNRHHCSMSHSQFLQIFHSADIFNSQKAEELFTPTEEQNLFFENKQERSKIISSEFQSQAYRQLQKLQQKRDSMFALLTETSTLQNQYMADNNINPLTGLPEEPVVEIFKYKEDMLCKVRYVKVSKTNKKEGGEANDQVSENSNDEGSVNFDSEEEKQNTGKVTALGTPPPEVSEELGQRKKPLTKQLLDNPLFDLKPYFRKMSEWDNRLKRLEQKIYSLSPELIFISLELHEMGINLLSKKMHKFVSVQKLIEEKIDAEQMRVQMIQEQKQKGTFE